jgi:hypothetical protein
MDVIQASKRVRQLWIYCYYKGHEASFIITVNS